MIALKVEAKNAQSAIAFLKKKSLLDRGFKIFRKGQLVYLPLSNKNHSDKPEKGIAGLAKRLGGEMTEERFRKADRNPIPAVPAFYEKASRGYDLLGNIAIIDAEPKAAKKVAKAVMLNNKNVETVVRKAGAVSGKYRTRKYAHVIGRRNYTATYRENGCIFEFDIRKTFFSQRLSYERKRIADASRGKENVMVMFAGVGPFAIEIAKHNRLANVIGIELNRYAYGAMKRNIELNGTANAEAIYGDVRKEVKRYENWADRVVMPLPMSSNAFLEEAASAARNGCRVHYYTFGGKDTAFEDAKAQIREFFSKQGTRARFAFGREVRPYSAREIEIVIDFIVRK